MDVYMDVGQVRGGSADLQELAPEARAASERVQAPAEDAASKNVGFRTGGAGLLWQSAFDTVTEALERRVEWQGTQVTTSADELESCDREVARRFRAIERELPAKKQD